MISRRALLASTTLALVAAPVLIPERPVCAPKNDSDPGAYHWFHEDVCMRCRMSREAFEDRALPWVKVKVITDDRHKERVWFFPQPAPYVGIQYDVVYRGRIKGNDGTYVIRKT